MLDGFPGWSIEFDLMYRQEQSRSSSGRTYVKDFGSPLWRATYQSKQLRINALDYWRARLDVAENGLNEFWGMELSRCYPIADPRGAKIGPAEVTIALVGANRKDITLAGLPAGYVLTPGDMIQIRTNDLHRIVRAESPGGIAGTSLVEVRPHLWPGAAVGDPVSLIRPHCKMVIVPGTINTSAEARTGRGAVTFQAIESR